MTVTTKNTGAYAAIVGVQHKKNGVCAAVAGCFAKVSGAYQSVLGPVVPAALRVAALGQRVPDSRMTAAGYTRFTSEYPFQVDKAHSSITLSFVNWWLTSGYATGSGGAVTIESLTVWVGSAAVSPGFPDGPQLVIADMATDAKSNPIPAAALGIQEFVPGVNYWMKVSWYAPAGYLPRNAVGWLAPTAGVKFAWYDPTSTALGNVSGPGAFTFGTATGLPVVTQSGGPVPFVLGTPVDGIDDSILIESDSNGAGTGDVVRALSVKGGGHAERAVMDYARKFASINFSKTNTTATQWAGTNGMAVVRAYYAYTKTIYNRLGGNDFLDAATATTLANYKTNQLTIVARYRAAGITKCVLGAIWTRTTDATGTPWTTLAGQTVAIGREPASAIPPDGGLTLQANKWLSEQADAVSAMRISFVPFTVMRDVPTNKWPVTSVDGQTTGVSNTTDGTHANPVGHEKGGAELYPFFANS